MPFDPAPEAEEAHLFHEGIALFNDGEFFEAHEVWEDIWRMASGDRKRFYQGLIQCAVTLEHIRRGNPRGVLNVFETARTKFSGLDDVYMGIDVAGLLRELGAMVAAVADMPAAATAPGAGRGQAMPVNLDQAPRIELKYDPFA